MTVRELIAALNEFDGDMTVQVIDDAWNEDINDVDDYDGVVLIRA